MLQYKVFYTQIELADICLLIFTLLIKALAHHNLNCKKAFNIHKHYNLLAVPSTRLFVGWVLGNPCEAGVILSCERPFLALGICQR